jgi:hypothetical protein
VSCTSFQCWWQTRRLALGDYELVRAEDPAPVRVPRAIPVVATG